MWSDETKLKKITHLWGWQLCGLTHSNIPNIMLYYYIKCFIKTYCISSKPCRDSSPYLTLLNGIYSTTQGTTLGIFFTPLFNGGKKEIPHKSRFLCLETINYGTIGINSKLPFGKDCPTLEGSLLPLSLKHLFVAEVCSVVTICH